MKSNKGGADLNRPVHLGGQVYWVGFWDSIAGLQCNPYLILDGEEAILIDGGSRPDFPTVMMKILQAGVSPRQIKALIYQHYDPDLCGSISNLEEMIGREDLQVISALPNHMFIRHFAARSRLLSFREVGYRFRFTSGRELQFAVTPYAHSPGSSIAFDPSSGILFTSDLLGSAARADGLLLVLSDECRACGGRKPCPHHGLVCPFLEMIRFQQFHFPCMRALQHAIGQIRKFPFKMIAPQHGAVIGEAVDGGLFLDRLAELRAVGIDGLLDGDGAPQDLW